jgi:hypothetical protein
MKMLKACLNPKMLAGLGCGGTTIYLVALSLVPRRTGG